MLGHSIRRTGTPHSLVCLHTEDVPESSLVLLRRIWDCRLIEHVEASKNLMWTEMQVDRFDKVFTKLQAMRLVEFEKVLMMDIDLLVTTSIDNLFQLPAPAALKRGPNDRHWGYKHGNSIDGRTFFGGGGKGKYSWGQGTGINAGVMLWQPSEDVLDQMLQELSEDCHPSHIKGNGPEQDYLSRYWAGAPWTNMAVEYNYQLHQMFFALHPDMRESAERTKFLQDPRRIKIVHFSGEPAAKPWHRVLDKKFKHLWNDRSRDAEYLQIFAEEFLGWWYWVKRDRSAWQKVEENKWKEGPLSTFTLCDDGHIYREQDASTSSKEQDSRACLRDQCESSKGDPPIDDDGHRKPEKKLVLADPPEAATEAAMQLLEHCLDKWFDTFQDLEKSLDLDIVASLTGKDKESAERTCDSEEEADPVEVFTWKSTWFATPPTGVPTPTRAPARNTRQGGGQLRYKFQHEGGWMTEQVIGHIPGDMSGGSQETTKVGKASVVCSTRPGACFVAFSEEETYFQEPGDADLSGVFVKAVGTTARPFLEGGDGDISSLHIWVSGVTAGSTVLVAIIGLEPELLEQVLLALEPLGVPQGPVRRECRALAAAGTAFASAPWVSTHAASDMAYASAPIPVRQ